MVGNIWMLRVLFLLFPVWVLTSTSTVHNDPPVYSPTEIHKIRPEDAEIGRHVVKIRAIDPDRAGKTSIKYKPVAAGWLSIGKDTGSSTVKSSVVTESQFVQDSKYITMAVASDKGKNDHPPVLLQKKVSQCNFDPVPVQLDIVDPDGPGHAGPFTVVLQRKDQINWVVHTNSTSNVALLTAKQTLAPGNYLVSMRIYDAGTRSQDSTLSVDVCQCVGIADACFIAQQPLPLLDIPTMTATFLGSVFIALFLLLMLVLGLLLLKSRKMSDEHAYLLEDLPRDSIFSYNEQGGEEQGKGFKLEELHRGLDNHRKIFRTDVFPMNPHPCYPLRPHQDDQEVAHFIGDSLHIANNDPTVPPYDTLLVFDYGDGAAGPGSLSSINSSHSDENQEVDLQHLTQWGPHFRKLADMYSGGTEEEDDDTETLPRKIEWV